MLFNSFEYFLFLPVIFFIYWMIREKKYQNLLLLFASYFFYSLWSWKFLALLCFSTVIDYSFAFYISNKTTWGKAIFWICIINNLFLLFVFKYFDFFINEAQSFLALFGINASSYLLKIVLPVGISFYTFHGLSYVIDVYRGNFKPVRNFIDYALFVCFFPLLVAGPIERASHLVPQIQTKRKFNYERCISGLRLILWGLFKKIIIADTLAVLVDKIWINYEHENPLTLLLGTIYFSIQIYADFSGYSDIAIGSAKLLGFELFSNFKFPYFSRNIIEFWKKWHISLYSWFRDYLYIPLGGSKHGRLIQLRNIFFVFILSGLWHGANSTFVIWGTIHTCFFLPFILKRHKLNKPDNTIWSLLNVLMTFLLVSLAWVFFRSPDLNIAFEYFQRIFTINEFMNMPTNKFGLVYLVVFFFFEWQFRHDERNPFESFKNIFIRWSTYILMVIMILDTFLNQESQSFIYFQF